MIIHSPACQEKPPALCADSSLLPENSCWYIPGELGQLQAI
jgi:hypothetical protein